MGEVTPLRDLGSIARAGTVAVVAIGIAAAMGLSVWWTAVIAASAMLLCAPLVDRALPGDVRTIVRAMLTSEDLEGHAGPSVTEGE